LLKIWGDSRLGFDSDQVKGEPRRLAEDTGYQGGSERSNSCPRVQDAKYAPIRKDWHSRDEMSGRRRRKELPKPDPTLWIEHGTGLLAALLSPVD
jgi:hypothetical protein